MSKTIENTVVTENAIVLPRAKKPLISARPKPAPSPKKA